MDNQNENLDSKDYNPNRPNNNDNNHEETKKVVDTAAKGVTEGVAEYFGASPGEGAKAYDIAKKVPVVGKAIDQDLNKSAANADKIPGVRQASQALNESGATNAINKGIDGIGATSSLNSNEPSLPNSSNKLNKTPNISNENQSSNESQNLPPNFRKNTLINNNIRNNDTIPDEEETPEEFSDENEEEPLNEDNQEPDLLESPEETEAESTTETTISQIFTIKNPSIFLFGGIGIIIFLLVIILIGGNESSFNSSSYSYNSLCSTGTNGDIVTFIEGFEGVAGNACTVNGKSGHTAIDSNDGTITTGPGISNHAIMSATSFIDEKNYGQYFNKRNNRYVMNVGDCLPDDVISDIKLNFLKTDEQSLLEVATNLGLDLTQYQIDALLSLAYNAGLSTASNALTAYKENSYEGLWNSMKNIIHSQGVEIPPLRKRRKAEFALFVTGDYSDQGLFYSRPTDPNYDDYNSEGVLERMNVCSQTSTDGLVLTIDGFLARKSRPLRNNPIFYDQNDPDLLAHSFFEGECSWYAGYRAQEILQNAGSNKTWSSMPDGGSYCSTNEVVSGTFASSTNVNAPHPGSLISWVGGSKAGHVAVVEEVYEDGSILISEAFVGLGGYGKTRISAAPASRKKYVRKENCESNNSGCFQTRVIPADAINRAGWNRGDRFSCYIYLLG